MTTVACAQLSPVIGEPAHNRALAADAVMRAAAAGADVLVLPELSTSGYAFSDAGEAARCAEPLDGPAVQNWRALSAEHGMVLVAGVCEALGDGRLGNSAVILDRGELVTAYRKTHLWDREKLVFAAGDEPVAHWVAALRRGRRLGTRTVECRGDFLSAARSTPVFADVLLGHRGTGCFGPEEICTLADVDAALRGAGIAVTPRPAPR